MRKHLYILAADLQHSLLEVGMPIDRAPRVILDAWASLWRWHMSGERIWRISAEQESALLDHPLPPDLDLRTAPTRGPAVAYQLPDRSQWLVLARHAGPTEPITVRGPEIGWAYRQPVLTYATLIDSVVASGYISLLDQPTAADVELRPGTGLRSALTAADIIDEDYRLALCILQHFRP